MSRVIERFRSVEERYCLKMAMRNVLLTILGALVVGCTQVGGAARVATASSPRLCAHTTFAQVVALEQTYQYNRYGAYNPRGMVYALARDVVSEEDDGTSGTPETPISALSEADVAKLVGKVRLRSGKRPRPLVLRVNDGDCLQVKFTNLLPPHEDGEEFVNDPETGHLVPIEVEGPRSRKASIHVNGLELAGDIRSDGAAVGRNPSGLIDPGQSITYRWLARGEGGYFFYSSGDPVSGEGNGGQTGLGLFGSINVEPKGAKWYRSQVEHSDMAAATSGQSALHTAIIDYAAKRGAAPLLSLTDDAGEIVHSDLNAVIAPAGGEGCATMDDGPGEPCGAGFREFTAIFHDELTAEQAFSDLADEGNPMSQLRDGMGINYGASGLGSMVMANRDTKGPGGRSRYARDASRECIECKLEEFFLTAWVVGDPAMVMKRDPADQHALEAEFPDDPSNVHHSYLGDPVRFRNIHAGPKETHVFHLHAHQWVRDPQSDKSVYLDSQTVGPGSSYTYQIHYGGSGNRNLEIGDSIFHCHLYPHFAQGMWAMWRTHDTFEDGTPGLFDPSRPAGLGNNPRSRNLPDAELAGGTPSPAVVPIPGRPLPPMATEAMPGFPFYIAGEIGHRPPQPPRDMDSASTNPNDPNREDGGLQRHVVMGGERHTGLPDDKYLDLARANANGLSPASVANAQRVRAQTNDPRLFGLASELTEARLKLLAWDGTAREQAAGRFHQGLASMFGDLPTTAVTPAKTHKPDDPARTWWTGVGYPSCDSAGTCYDPAQGNPDLLFRVNGKPAQMGAPFADPCAAGAPDRTYRAAYLQFDMPVNRYGWHDPQARSIVLEQDIASTLNGSRPAEPFFMRANSGECVTFKATNLVPSVLNLDDFQVYSPTDTIGQHIHLVKFDVTSSDGSANGWNYEDATLSADEVRERIIANNRFQIRTGGGQLLKPKVHAMFKPGGAMAGDARGQCGATALDWQKHPWCGAQTTVQRWWADPLRDMAGEDRTIRTVFTHDHLGPSSHQHHGLYAALVVEPTGSRWTSIDGLTVLGDVDASGKPIAQRDDGGPTSWAANILTPNGTDPVKGDRREYNLAFADYAILYDAANRPVNPPNRVDHDLPTFGLHDTKPKPEGISTKDPGSQLLNYRHEPMPLRIAGFDGASWKQRDGTAHDDCRKNRTDALGQLIRGAEQVELDNAESGILAETKIRVMCDRGDPANLFSSRTHGDPSTHLLPAYQGDRVQVRLIQGAQEENHVFFINGGKWLSQPGSADSGWMAGQQLGISEHFEFDVEVTEHSPQVAVDHLLGASASDNLWDGQWSILRAYRPDVTLSKPAVTAGGSPVAPLAHLRNNPETPLPTTDPLSRVCVPPGGPVSADSPLYRKFEIVAMRVADLLGDPQGLVYNSEFGITDPNAIVFFEKRDEDDLRQHRRAVEPLVLRAPAGACIDVQLINRLRPQMPDGPDHKASWSYNAMPPIVEGMNFNDFRTSARVGLHAQLVVGNSFFDDGANVGGNADSTIPAAECPFTMTTTQCDADPVEGIKPSWIAAAKRQPYRWYAGDASLILRGPQAGNRRNVPVEYGIAAIKDFGDVIKHSSHGAIGALVIEPEGAVSRSDCEILKAAGVVSSRPCLNAAATVEYTDHDGRKQRFRELTVLYQDDLSLHRNGMPMENLGGDDDSEDTGQRAFSYRMEPLWARAGASESSQPEDLLNYDFGDVLSSFRCPDRSASNPCADGSNPQIVDPGTGLLTLGVGEQLRLRVAHPSGHPRNHAFSVSGHSWQSEPYGNYADPNADIGSRWQGDAANNWSRRRYGAMAGIGPGRHLNLLLGPAGGRFGVSGDYLYRSQDGLAFSSGQWGLIRVLPDCKKGKRTNGNGDVCR